MFTSIKPDWSYTPEAIIVSCKDAEEAKTRMWNEYEHWAMIATRFRVQETRLQYKVQGKSRHYSVLASDPATPSTPSMSGLTVIREVYLSPQIPVNRELYQVMGRMIEADRPMFLLCNETDDQVWINQLACDMIQSSGQEAVRRCMRDYWERSDLESLHQKLRDTSQPFEHGYRAILNDEQNDVWFSAVNIYEPVEVNGQSFRLSVNQHFEIIGRAGLMTVR